MSPDWEGNGAVGEVVSQVREYALRWAVAGVRSRRTRGPAFEPTLVPFAILRLPVFKRRAMRLFPSCPNTVLASRHHYPTHPPSSPPLPLPDLSDLAATTSDGKAGRRSTFNIIHSLAGQDSNLPLPRRRAQPRWHSQGVRRPDGFWSRPQSIVQVPTRPTQPPSCACQSFNIWCHRHKLLKGIQFPL